MSDSLYKIGELYARYSLSDEVFQKLEPHLPKEKPTGRPGMDIRLFLDALIFMVREGCCWRAIPSTFGKWNSIYKKFRKWESENVFQKIYWILLGLCEETQEDLANIDRTVYSISIDSTSNKVHQHACGARKDAPGADTHQEIGISRGGPNTKIHALVTDEMQMVAFEITGGQVHDSKMAIPLLESTHISFLMFNADKAYGDKQIRQYVADLNAIMVCPNKSNAKVIYEFDREEYKERNIVERFFQRLKCFRRIATRYDKLALVYRAFIYIASILIHLGNTTREKELRQNSSLRRNTSSE